MDAFTPINEMLDMTDRWRIMDAIAAATTNEEVLEIQATCQHKYPLLSHTCSLCGHVQTVEEIEADNEIPFL